MTQIKELTLLVKEVREFLLQKLIRSHIKKPWMKYKEIVIISEILRRKKLKRCLEWGAGYSTGYFPKDVEEDALWIAVEHQRDWYKEIKQNVSRSNTKVYYVPPNNFPWTDTYNDGASSDLKDYIEFPKSLNMKFDFILIDGRARKDCLLCALDILNRDGIVVLHDADRAYYHENFQFYEHQVLFSDYGRRGGLWIGSRNLNPQTVSDFKKLEQIWKTLNTLEKWKNMFRLGSVARCCSRS